LQTFALHALNLSWLSGVQGHAEDLERLYGLFHGIVDVHARLVDLLQQLQSGFYIQCSVQSLMLVGAELRLFPTTVQSAEVWQQSPNSHH